MNQIKLFWTWHKDGRIDELETEVNTFLETLDDKVYDTVISTTPETSDSYYTLMCIIHIGLDKSTTNVSRSIYTKKIDVYNHY